MYANSRTQKVLAASLLLVLVSLIGLVIFFRYKVFRQENTLQSRVETALSQGKVVSEAVYASGSPILKLASSQQALVVWEVRGKVYDLRRGVDGTTRAEFVVNGDKNNLKIPFIIGFLDGSVTLGQYGSGFDDSTVTWQQASQEVIFDKVKSGDDVVLRITWQSQPEGPGSMEELGKLEMLWDTPVRRMKEGKSFSMDKEFVFGQIATDIGISL